MRRNLKCPVPTISTSVPTTDGLGELLPSIKLIDRLSRVGSKNAEYVGEKGLPYSKFKLMQHVNC